MGQDGPANRRRKRNGARTTKAKAGIICTNVRVACDANAASSAANIGGPDCEGCASATARRSTTATEITMQAQNPMRTQRQELFIFQTYYAHSGAEMRG